MTSRKKTYDEMVDELVHQQRSDIHDLYDLHFKYVRSSRRWISIFGAIAALSFSVLAVSSSVRTFS
jgi:hypothetical protein